MPSMFRGRKARHSSYALLEVPFARTVLALAALIALAACAPGAFAADATLVTSGAGGVSFDIAVPEPRFTNIKTANATYQRFDLGDYEWEGGGGQPMLPATGVLIAVPEGAQVSVVATGEGAREYEGLRLLPQQELPRADARGGVTSAIAPQGTLPQALYEDRAAYARVGYGSDALAVVGGVTHMRAQRVAKIVVRPAAYDPSAGRVRIYARVHVQVTFTGGVVPAATPDLAARAAAASASASDPFEELYRSGLLNYESGRAWRVDPGANSLRSKGLSTQATGPNGVLGAREDFTSSPNWLKLEVSAKGVYRVDGTDILAAGYNPAAVDPRTIRIFVRPGITLVPENEPPAIWLTEVAANVVGESDGTFDSADYVLFFGMGVSGWRDEYTPASSDSGFLNHPYETKNEYWMTWGGTFSAPPRRWSVKNGAPEDPAAYTAPSYPARQHFESDQVYKPDLQVGGNFHDYSGVFWEKWIWQDITDQSGPIPFVFNLPGAVTTAPARLYTRLWGDSRELFSGSGVRDHYLNVTINDIPMAERAFYDFRMQDFDTTFIGIRELGNRFTVQCRKVSDPFNPNRKDQVALFWFDIYYQRRLTPTNNQLDFASPDTTGPVAYGVGPFTQTTGLFLLDTTDPVSPVQVTGLVERDTTGGKAIYFKDDVPAHRRYLAFTSANVRRPDAITRVAIDDLRNPANSADYVVITYDAFAPSAQKLATHRASHLGGVANPRTRVVKISDIYAWYSGGRTDPTAIRNFLYDAVKTVGWSPAPSYVCFLGDASYDFKNIYRLAPAGQPAALVPSYVNGHQTRQFMTDDWLVDLDLGVREKSPTPGFLDSINFDMPDLIVGRLPAASAQEAQFLVESKVIPYETQPAFGEWRARGLLLADDATQGFLDDPLSFQHMQETESLSVKYIAPVVEQDKIYLVKYPYGSGSEKPAANRDVKAAVSGGELFWNYIGHGNPFKMADENAFINSDVGSLTNQNELTFLVAASCDLGKFDDPIVTGLGENLLKSRTGGAIASFSASDIAFAFSNVYLAKALFANMFNQTSTGFDLPLGAAVYRAKVLRNPVQLSVNDLKYGLMGDPGMRLAMPNLDARLTIADAETGVPVDTLRRGSHVRLTGYMSQSHDPSINVPDAAFNGVASLLVTDAPPPDTASTQFERCAFYYNPGTIFHGDVQVVNGQFDASFIVPLEAFMGKGAKVRLYASNGQTDGAGVEVRPLTVGTSTVIDTTGPVIGLAFTNGLTKVPPNATLRILVRDENGVNLTGHTIPNALYLTIDGLARYDLTQAFRYDAGSYQQGTVEFQLPGIDPGPHSIVVSAADNYAQGVLGKKNRSTAAIDFEVSESTEFALGRVYNFPNPFQSGPGTSFVITGLSEAAQVQVKIYTVSGSLVRILQTAGGPGQVQLAWDGKDAYGGTLANGAYTYLVQAEGDVSKSVVRYRGQAAVLR